MTPTVVFVHGFLGNALNWSPVKQRLEIQLNRGQLASVNFLSVDLLGHGKKSELSEMTSLTLESVALDLAKEIPEGPFIAVAHSFGIRPWLTLFKDKKLSSRCLAFVVEDSSPVISEAGFDNLIQIFDQVELPQADRQLAKNAIEKVFEKDSKMSRFLMTNVTQLKDGTYGWRFHAQKLRALLLEARDTQLWDEWSSLKLPVFLVMGANSHFVPKARVEECVSRRIGLQTGVVWIEGAGHWVHADQVDLFTSELSKIINFTLTKA